MLTLFVIVWWFIGSYAIARLSYLMIPSLTVADCLIAIMVGWLGPLNFFWWLLYFPREHRASWLNKRVL
jgi:hypothetical protein